MTLKTLECRLYAPSDTLRYLWLLMSEKNTPLINEIINHLSEHPDFDEWFKGKQIPKSAIAAVCNNLKSQETYQNQPGRFYTSAIALTHYMFKSWFAIQKQLQRRIEGKQRWLNLLKSDQPRKYSKLLLTFSKVSLSGKSRDYRRGSNGFIPTCDYSSG